MMQPNRTEETQMTAEQSGEQGKEHQTDFIDKICDPCGLVPNNLEEALAHKKKMKSIKIQEREASKMMDSGNSNGNGNGVDPVEISDENNDDHAVDSMLSTFDIDCWGKQTSKVNDKGTEDKPVSQAEFLKSDNNSFDDRERSLADIAAKMNDIDLETAAEDNSVDDDDKMPDYSSVCRSGGKAQMAWFKSPLYAGLFVLCGAFSIAIIVMAILLIVRK